MLNKEVLEIISASEMYDKNAVLRKTRETIFRTSILDLQLVDIKNQKKRKRNTSCETDTCEMPPHNKRAKFSTLEESEEEQIFAKRNEIVDTLLQHTYLLREECSKLINLIDV